MSERHIQQINGIRLTKDDWGGDGKDKQPAATPGSLTSRLTDWRIPFNLIRSFTLLSDLPCKLIQPSPGGVHEGPFLH
jgi:hypothetical protein